MKQQLAQIRQSAADELTTIKTKEQLEAFRVAYLGKKGQLTQVLRGMGALSNEERPVIGQLANEVRGFIEASIESFKANLEQQEFLAAMESEKLDVTMPGTKRAAGKTHPLTTVLNQVKDIFIGMGFEIAEGPEIDTVYYNFDALNAPANHPSRDMQDTFYINDDVLLRTQTSGVQIHAMEQKKPPIRIIAPGCVYRKDEVDATHSPVFHQIEGLVVDKGVRMSDLKGTLEVFCQKLYGADTRVRFRPHHFPFTEPSAEMDVTCPACNGSGCRVCKGEGWVEILGAGMVHPKVLRNCGIDPEEYSGFAFGLGLERIVMRKYDIDDMRLLFENDLRFLSQF